MDTDNKILVLKFEMIWLQINAFNLNKSSSCFYCVYTMKYAKLVITGETCVKTNQTKQTKTNQTKYIYLVNLFI